MNKVYSSTLSYKRIFISLFIIFAIIPCKMLILKLFNNATIAYTFAYNICGSLLIMYDWNLFEIHYMRSKKSLGTTLLYTLIASILLSIILVLNVFFIHGNVIVFAHHQIVNLPLALPAVLIAFSFMQACVISIGYKCITDHIKIHANEFIVILVSGFVFSFLYQFIILGLPINFLSILLTYIYHILIICVLSYSYNQSNSLIPGILSFTIIYFIYQLVLLF